MSKFIMKKRRTSTRKLLLLVLFALSFHYIFYAFKVIRDIEHVNVSPNSETILKRTDTSSEHASLKTGVAKADAMTEYWHGKPSGGYKQPRGLNMKGIKSSDRKTREPKHRFDDYIINGSIYNPLHFIPKVANEKSHIVPYLRETLTKMYLVLSEKEYTQNIAILTPVRNAKDTLDLFLTQLVGLSYPHHLISVYFGESGSFDNTFKKARKVAYALKNVYNFKDSDVTKLNLTGGIHGNNTFRHKKEFQLYRRSHLALARNRLLRYALAQGIFDQVLWIDSDVIEFPKDLIQQMLFAESDVVVTSCLVRKNDIKRLYDCNSWRETRLSFKNISLMSPDKLVLECYGETERIFLPYLKREGRVVKLDGVGGCALMVKADCFRSGLQFPEVVYKHHIETEGLAKMALDMGFSVVGLPFVEVFHQTPNKRE